jgi:hypothetical protein
VPIAAGVKITRTETVAAAALQKSKNSVLEFLKEIRKVSNDHGIPARRRRKMKQVTDNAGPDPLRWRHQILSQHHEANGIQKSNFGPVQKRTAFIIKI